MFTRKLAAFVLFSLLLCAEASAQLDVYGFVRGFKTPQKLSLAQIEAIKTQSFDGLDTWLVIVDKLNTPAPRVHFIDTEYFKKFTSEYGVHQAYAEQMGIASNTNDFVDKMYGAPRARSIMPLTLYNFNQDTVAAPNLKLANWVLQNRRYRFKDSAASFAASLVKSQKAVSASFPLVKGLPHFITYESAGSFRRPNRSTPDGKKDIAALAALGFATLSENEMVSALGLRISQVQVHNPVEKNEAFGFLKVIEQDSDIEALTPQHIAIFKTLPDRIPPVAAIVTLEAQTPLSHINVLAINRGTLNVAVNEAASAIVEDVLKNAALMGDRPVKLSVGRDQISIAETSTEKVAEFQAAQRQRIGGVVIPDANTSTGLVVVKPTAAHGVTEIGAKAANYGKIERLLGNTLVTPGYAIGFALYRTIVTDGGEASIEKTLIAPLLAKVKAGQIAPAQVNIELANIRAAIAGKKLPQETVDSLARLASSSDFKADGKMRFRSSTNCEDLPRFNGAGLYLSDGIKVKHVLEANTNPASLKKLHETLLLVLGSLWLPPAFWEREYFSIDHTKAALAIQINPSFTEEAANGVLIVSKDHGRYNYWINSQLGEASVTNPLDGQIPESLKVQSAATNAAQLSKDITAAAPTPQSQSSIGPIFVQTTGALNPERTGLLAQTLFTGQRILDSLVTEFDKFGIDIEFKLVDEAGGLKLYMKQARPLRLGTEH